MKDLATIRNEFIVTYGPDALNKLGDKQLAQLLFADNDAGHALGIRGMFTWLEFADPDNDIPDNSWGSCGVVARYGIWLGEDEQYIHHDPSAGIHGITEDEALMAARITRDVICKICTEVDNAALNTIDDYRALDAKIAGICPQSNNYYWSKDGNLYIYLIKYLHILYPEKVAECFSDSKIGDKLNVYGKVVRKSWHRIIKNGVVCLAERGII